jgi:hypothetical protein
MMICEGALLSSALFLPYVLRMVWCLSKSYAHTNNCKKNLLKKDRKEKRKNRKEKHNSRD